MKQERASLECKFLIRLGFNNCQFVAALQQNAYKDAHGGIQCQIN